MATLIPNTLPSTASQGEKRLFHLLQQKLPNDFLVWYEPIVQGRYPDFIILGPHFGLLIIEVKGWYPSQILQANPDSFKIKYKQGDLETIQNQKSPLRQCKDYLNRLLDSLKAYPVLTQNQGHHQGQLAFPLGMGAIMSNITAQQATTDPLNLNQAALLPQPQVAYRDELLAWPDWTSEQLIERLQQMFAVKFAFAPLTSDQINTIRGLLYPEIIIQAIPARHDSIPKGESLLPSATILKTLDTRQENLAKSIGEGHRIFFGVSGSGKTLILMARAKMLAQQHPHARILLLCFNVSLASHLRSVIQTNTQNANYSNLEIIHFHGWAKSCLGSLPTHVPDFDETVARDLLDYLAEMPQSQKWDAILIDEAHTFVPSWFRCCVAALKDPENGDLTIVADGSQSLYKRDGFTWKQVGIKAQGRTISKKFDLDKNYRNTQPILNAAWKIVQPAHEQTILETDEVTFPVVQPTQALRQGSRPTLHLVSAPEKAIINQVQRLLAQNYAPEDIAIIYYQVKKPAMKQLLASFNQAGIKTYWVTKNQKAKERYSVSLPGIRILTGLSSLGLEFKVVLLIWLEQFGDCVKSTVGSQLKRKQLYVAMTRTQEELHLFSDPNNPLLAELKQSDAFAWQSD